MRDIKFRAWDKFGETMITSDELLVANSPYLKHSFVDTKKLKLMQYTGLKDVNGVEIYEGDIVEFSSSWDKHVCTVSFNKCKFGFGIEIKGELGINDDCDLSSFMRGSGCNGYTVIGNIHQNPELLEQKQ